jgi:hypothetical protein
MKNEWITTMAILLPPHLAHLAKPNVPPVKISVFVTMEQITGKPVTIADLIGELISLKRSDVIRWVTTISAKLADSNRLERERQRELALMLLSNDLINGVNKWLKNGEQWNWALFHRRQMWFLLQMAVVSCKEETPPCDDKVLAKTIGKAALLVNDVLLAIEPQQDGEEWKTNYGRCFVTSVLPKLDQTDRMEIAVRAHQFWFEISRTQEIAKRFRLSGVPDIARAFESKYQLTLERFYFIALSLWCRFHNHANTNETPLLFETEQYLVPYFGKDDTARAMAILSQSPDRLSRDVLSTPRQNWAVDLSLLKARPIVEVFPGKYACPDLAILYRYLTEGVYFLLQDAYDLNRFRELFGHLFESYIGNLIHNFAVASDLLIRTFWPSPKFIGSTDQACDGLLYDRDLAVLMEYKASQLSTRERYAGIPEATWKGIESIVAKDASGGKKGAFQLARTIRRILQGEAVASGHSKFCATVTTSVVPVLVTYDEGLSLGAIRRWADGKMRQALKKEGINTSQVGPLLILTIHDIERLEALSIKNSWTEIISGYAKYVQDHPDDPMATFGIYLSKSNFQTEERGTSFLAKAFENAMEFAKKGVADCEPLRTQG